MPRPQTSLRIFLASRKIKMSRPPSKVRREPTSIRSQPRGLAPLVPLIKRDVTEALAKSAPIPNVKVDESTLFYLTLSRLIAPISSPSQPKENAWELHFADLPGSAVREEPRGSGSRSLLSARTRHRASASAWRRRGAPSGRQRRFLAPL